MAQRINNPPAIQETQKMWVRSLGWEDPLEEDMATLSRILAWENPIDRGAWWTPVHRAAWVRDRTEWLSTHIYLSIHYLSITYLSLSASLLLDGCYSQTSSTSCQQDDGHSSRLSIVSISSLAWDELQPLWQDPWKIHVPSQSLC